jgi:plastocyanin
MSDGTSWLTKLVLGMALLATLLVELILPGPVAAATVTMQLGSDEGFLAFQPDQLTLAAGDRVHFTVQGLGPHNLIVADHPEWSHPALSFAAGDSWEQAFPEPGTYSIWCEPHRAAGMTGTITVQAPAA